MILTCTGIFTLLLNADRKTKEDKGKEKPNRSVGCDGTTENMSVQMSDAAARFLR